MIYQKAMYQTREIVCGILTEHTLVVLTFLEKSGMETTIIDLPHQNEVPVQEIGLVQKNTTVG